MCEEGRGAGTSTVVLCLTLWGRLSQNTEHSDSVRLAGQQSLALLPSEGMTLSTAQWRQVLATSSASLLTVTISLSLRLYS